jgi:signal transduction histidine kinase/CheY-like chemotaxis protein
VPEVLALTGAACLATAVAALLGAGTSALVTGAPFWAAHRTWWTSEALGLLLVTPLAVTWVRPRPFTPLHGKRVAEAVVIAGVWCASAWIVYSPGTANAPFAPFPYLHVALVAWVGLRLGPRGVAAALVVLAVAAVRGASADSGLMFGEEDPTRRILLVQLYLATTAVTGLLLAASVAEAREAADASLAAEAALHESQKLESVGRLAGGVAHDFNNMLAAILMEVELAETYPDLPDDIREILKEIREAAGRAGVLTRQLMLFGRKDVLQRRPLDLNACVTAIAVLLQRLLHEDVRLQIALYPRALVTLADPSMLDQVILNLAVNARDAMPQGGTLLIETGERHLTAEEKCSAPDASPGLHVWLRVQDTGSGIAAESLPHIFEPFFTTKPAGKGTGLGLSQVYGFAKQNGGAVTVTSAPGDGTTVTLFLRRAEPAARAAAGEIRPKPGNKVLLVEDNEDVAEAAAAMLDSIGCTVKHASAAEPALKILAAGETFDLVFTDIVMPGGMDGVELARALRARYPSLPVLLTTGYSNAAQKAAGEKFSILLKPYQLGALERAAAEAVGGGAAEAGPA